MTRSHDRRTAPSRRRPLAWAVLVLCLVGLAVCGVLWVQRQSELSDASQKLEELAALATQPSFEDLPVLMDQEAELPQNPVDFEALAQQNPDIYAWIRVPGTDVNHPVLQHPTDDFFYLTHDTDGAESFPGSVYTEMQNAKDFSDPVTVIYGHYIEGGLMFATLHDFKDAAFFEQNPEFQIYTPGHVLTYRVVAAAGTDDSHILNTHDFSDPAQRTAYFDGLLHPATEEANVREGAVLDADSKIVQLSTCNYTCGNARYVVTGLLVNDQPTA